MIKSSNLFLAIIVILAISGFLYFRQSIPAKKALETSLTPTVTSASPVQTPTDMTVIAGGLDTPWAITFLPDGSLLLTERPGRVRLIDNQGELKAEPIATLSSVKEIGEGGLMGIAAHPDFASNRYIYLYYTYESSGDDSINRVVRMTYQSDKLSGETTIVDNIPGASNHNGGRIKFGPDNFLYIGTGDASNPSLAQDKNSLAGKILKVTDEGKPAPGNPFNNLVYSYGHRNVQGLAWSDDKTLWATEHGSSAHDELNYIEKGKNYGWPEVSGDELSPGINSPILQSETDTWAPGGLASYAKSFYFAGLRGQSVFQVKFEGGPRLLTHLKSEFGRVREVIVGPDNRLYISTSNQDGRGLPDLSDDRIIRVNPDKL